MFLRVISRSSFRRGRKVSGTFIVWFVHDLYFLRASENKVREKERNKQRTLEAYLRSQSLDSDERSKRGLRRTTLPATQLKQLFF